MTLAHCHPQIPVIRSCIEKGTFGKGEYWSGIHIPCQIRVTPLLQAADLTPLGAIAWISNGSA